MPNCSSFVRSLRQSWRRSRRELEVDRVPGELEPLVDPLEQHAAGVALLLDVAEHVGVHVALLLLGVVALVATERPDVGHAEPARHAELGDHHRLVAVVGAERVRGSRSTGRPRRRAVARTSGTPGSGAGSPGSRGRRGSSRRSRRASASVAARCVASIDTRSSCSSGSYGWSSGSAVSQFVNVSGLLQPRSASRRARWSSSGGDPALHRASHPRSR